MSPRIVIPSFILLGIACNAFAQAPTHEGSDAPPKAVPARQGPPRATRPPLFFKEEWKQPENPGGQRPATAAAVSNANLELHLYGPAGKDVQLSGDARIETGPLNLWTGMCNSPVAATLRDKNNYVDLTGLARVRWITRASGFHAVRPVVKLADGTWLVGDHTDASTTEFLESEFSFTGIRWIKLDVERVVTVGKYGPVGEASSWVDNPDLSKVDEVGFADLMPGSGHGSGGWVNVGKFEVYGKPVKR